MLFWEHHFRNGCRVMAWWLGDGWCDGRGCAVSANWHHLKQITVRIRSCDRSDTVGLVLLLWRLSVLVCLMVRTVGCRSLTLPIWLLRVTVRIRGCTNSDTVHLVLLLLRLTACIRLMVRTVQLRGLTLMTILLLMDDLLLCGLVSFLPDKIFSLRYKLLNLRS